MRSSWKAGRALIGDISTAVDDGHRWRSAVTTDQDSCARKKANAGQSLLPKLCLTLFLLVSCTAPPCLAQNIGDLAPPPLRPPAGELHLPAAERNSIFTYFPPARAAWNGHHGGQGDRLPPENLIPQQLHPNQDHIYVLEVPPPESYMSVSVHPRRGFITWNISFEGVNVMTHPFYTSGVPQRLPIPPGEEARQPRPDPMHMGLGHQDPLQGYYNHPHQRYGTHGTARYYGRRRKKRQAPERNTSQPTRQLLKDEPDLPRSRVKRCCVTGAPEHDYDFDVVELNAGLLGTSVGPGSLTYFKEDATAGEYLINVRNLGSSVADFLIFTSLHPMNGPYPHMQGNDPQIKVGNVEAQRIELNWEPPPEQPNVVFCPVLHTAAKHKSSDVHSSSYAEWMERPEARHPACVKAPGRSTVLYDLLPDTEYHIDLLVRNVVSLREATFLGVVARTKPLARNPFPLTFFSEGSTWLGLRWKTEKSGAASGATSPMLVLSQWTWNKILLCVATVLISVVYL